MRTLCLTPVAVFVLTGINASAAEKDKPVPARTMPAAESARAEVPATGKLGEHELILMAIASRPELEKLRGAVAVAQAEKRAAGDLQNPELRFSYAQDNDDRIGEPYTEYETLEADTVESFDSFSSSTGVVNPDGPESRVTSERGTVRNSRFREIERRVTPGATEDVVEERIYETNSSTTTSSRSRSETDKGGPSSRFDRRGEKENRKLVGTSRRVIKHPDESGRDNAWGVLLRFQLPHPWERKARIQRAAAKISLAEAEYYAEEDKVVRTVRAAVQELAILQARLGNQSSRKAGFEKYRNWLEEQKVPRLGLDLAGARAKVYDVVLEIRQLETDIVSMRDELAAYCGLSDASRIAPALRARRVSSPASLDLEYLTNIAMLYRSDVLDTQARLTVARAELAEVKATRIPFATFVDLGYTQVNSLRRTGQSDEWFARVGVSLPIWDWIGVNKRRKVPEATSQSLERQLTVQRTIISNEIAQALKRLNSADEQLVSSEKDLADLKADLKKAQEESQMATADVNDLIKARKIEHDFEDLAQQMEVSRFSALSAYQDALMALEKALGTRVDQVLDGTSPNKP